MNSSRMITPEAIEEDFKNIGLDQEDLHVEATINFINRYINTIQRKIGDEELILQEALGRILAQDIISPINVPPANNSAMDGYAFNAVALISPDDNIELTVKSTALAGTNINDLPKDFDPHKDALRIMTGAVVPSFCDTVIPQENVQLNNDTISFFSKIVKAFSNVRHQGEDLSAGQVALNTRKVLTPSDLGLIASLGIAQIRVKRRLKVAIFSTGNEVHPIGKQLPSGGIYDSNRYTLLGMLTRLGVQIIDIGIVKDDPNLLKQAFTKAAQEADVIITSGGVSTGQADYTKQVMKELGEVVFWKLAIKPGRPMAFGKIVAEDKEALLFGLPGNPVAVMVTFYQFARNAILQMAGANSVQPTLLQASLGSDYKKRPGRTEFVRATLDKDSQGRVWATPLPNQGSAILSSMSQADCFIILGHETGDLDKGCIIDIATFEGLI